MSLAKEQVRELAVSVYAREWASVFELEDYIVEFLQGVWRVRTERQIEKKFCDAAAADGWLVRKLNFGEGWPDRMLLRDGDCVFIEFKRPGGKVSKLQAHVFDTLTDQGFSVCIIDDGTSYVDFRASCMDAHGLYPSELAECVFAWENTREHV